MASDIPAPPDPSEVPSVTIVHKVKSKLGYTEMHATAQGFVDGDKELVGSSGSDRNWKGISIAIFVILLVLCGVAVSVVILTPPDSGPRVKGQRFTIQHILDKKYFPRRFNGTWISASELVLRDSTGGLSILDVNQLNTTQIVSNTIFRRFDVFRYSLSPNRKFVLLCHRAKQRYRYSTFAHYTVYEISTGQTWEVSARGDLDDEELAMNTAQGGPLELPLLLYAAWLPGGSAVEAPILFVENFALFYIPDVGAKSKKIYPLTQLEDVKPEIIIHGVPDWIYEEDILKRDNAIWISPDGKKIVYATFNDTDVAEVTWRIYGDADQAGTNPYSKQASMRYPKAGTPNPTATLWMVNLTDINDMKSEQIRVPNLFRKTEHYFTAVSWKDSDSVAVIWMNRAQNISIVTECGPPSWICKETFRETVGDNAWCTLYTAPLYSASASTFLLLTPIRDGDYGNYRHIALIETSQTHRMHPLTLGLFEVEEILGWDQDNGFVFFRGVPQDRPSERHIYFVDDDWRSGPAAPVCMTCQMPLDLPDRICSFNSAIFSPSFTHFVLECLGPQVPASYLMSVSQTDSNQTLVLVLDDNAETQNFSASMAWPIVTKFSIPLSGGREVRAKLYKPPEFIPDEQDEYPIVVHVYSGPGSQLVLDDWKMDFNTYMASGLSYVVLEVDGSGSGGQGLAKLTEVKNKLGQIEVQDQLDALSYVIKNFSFIDGDRVAVTGVSYGGYVAALMLADPVKDDVHCGVSVCPVTDWRFYESAYTERYMGLPIPTDNFRGYQEGSLIEKAKYIKGKAYFLAHGMADRNVHVQNSMLLAKALVANNIPFEQYFYPDEDHFLDGVKTHLFYAVSRFLERCLYKPLLPVEGEITYAYKKGKLVAYIEGPDETVELLDVGEDGKVHEEDED